jgi:hypothetical protein
VEHSARGFLPEQGKEFLKYYTGERWTKQLIAFLWTHSHTFWKDRCAVVHAPAEDSPDNSSARSRQAAQQRVETAYAYAPLMLVLRWGRYSGLYSVLTKVSAATSVLRCDNRFLVFKKSCRINSVVRNSSTRTGGKCEPATGNNEVC